MRGSTPALVPSLRYSSAAGMWPSRVKCRTPCALSSASRSPAALTKRIARLLDSPRWQRAANAGARPQRFLFASTGTKDPKASDILYVKSLAAPLTVNTMPDATLKALADHGEIGATFAARRWRLRASAGKVRKAGIDIDALAAQLQDEGAKSFVQLLDRPDVGDRGKKRRAEAGGG